MASPVARPQSQTATIRRGHEPQVRGHRQDIEGTTLTDASGNTYDVDDNAEDGVTTTARHTSPTQPAARLSCLKQSVLEGTVFYVPTVDTTLQVHVSNNFGGTGVWVVP